jgi:hypothetical protein
MAVKGMELYYSKIKGKNVESQNVEYLKTFTHLHNANMGVISSKM